MTSSTPKIAGLSVGLFLGWILHLALLAGCERPPAPVYVKPLTPEQIAEANKRQAEYQERRRAGECRVRALDGTPIMEAVDPVTGRTFYWIGKRDVGAALVVVEPKEKLAEEVK